MSQTTSPPGRCTRCGQPLEEARLNGICPACLWTDVFAEPVDDGVGPAPASGGRLGGLIPIPGHDVEAEIARGGMGIVYRARQLDPSRTVALKMLLPHQRGSESMRERFRIEAQTVAGLDHPAILAVYQVGESDGLPWFTMKLASGGSLATRRSEFDGNWPATAGLLATVADAVQFAHEHGVLHRDLKPGNILFDETGRPYVSDFGLAKLTGFDTDLTRSTDLLGTPHYVAPEVAACSARAATIASDVYSLGAILYELLTGRTPFAAEGVPALLKKIVEDPVEPPSRRRAHQATAASPSSAATIPRDLEIICLKCLAKEPARRYVSARELTGDLRRWLDGRPILARPATGFERFQSWARRNPVVATLSGVLVVVVLVGAVLQERAYRRTTRALAESLHAQAGLLRGTGRAGQRFETLKLIERAAGLTPRNDAERRARLRTEAAGALALPDLRLADRWPAAMAHLENEYDFSPSLEHYAGLTPDGGFGVFATRTREAVWQAEGNPTNPPVRFRLNADARWLGVRFQDGHVELFSTNQTQSVRRWLPYPRAHSVLGFSPKGDYFASSRSAETSGWLVDVLRLADDRIIATFASKEGPSVLAIDPGGTKVVSGASELTLRDLTGTVHWRRSLTNNAGALAWSPDGRRIAVSVNRHAGPGGGVFAADPVHVVNAADGRTETMIVLDEGTRVQRLVFHPDSQSVAVTTWSGELIWQSLARTERRLVVESAPGALGFSRDGRRLAIAPAKGELGLLEVAQSAVWFPWRTPLPPGGPAYTMAVSRDGRWLATAGKTRLEFWNTVTREQALSLPLPAEAWYAIALFGERDEFLYLSAASFGIRRLELKREQPADGPERLVVGPMQLISEPQNMGAIRFGPDQRSLIVSQNHRSAPNEPIPPTIWYWPEGDSTRARKVAEGFPLLGFGVLPGGRWGVSTDLVTPDLWIWDFETGERVRSLGFDTPVASEPTPDGRWLITKTPGEFGAWRVDDWSRQHHWPARADELNSSMAVSSDSRLLGVIGSNGDIILRALPNGLMLLRLVPPTTLRIAAVEFGPDSKRLFLLSQTGQVFEWELAELRRELARLDLDWTD